MILSIKAIDGKTSSCDCEDLSAKNKQLALRSFMITGHVNDGTLMADVTMVEVRNNLTVGAENKTQSKRRNMKGRVLKLEIIIEED